MSDARETQFSFATKKRDSLVDKLKSKALTVFLERGAHFDLEPCACRSSATRAPRGTCPRNASSSGRSSAATAALCIGSGPGALYDQKKFDTPYIRDYLLDRGALADVSETSAPWSALPGLYDNVMAAARGAFDELGVKGYIMCHLSHSYHSGACLYFTFAFKPSERAGPARAVRHRQVGDPADVHRLGATLSHHHAVGIEHALARGGHLGPRASQMVRALLDGIDPAQNLNPGKIV